jgi:DHA1 family purine base/nucleoside efflux pump-like MFS transporter
MNIGIFILTIVTFVSGTVEFMVAGMLDIIAKDLGISNGAVGQLVSIFSIVFAIGAPILIALTSKMERKKLLLIAMSVFILGNIISYFSPNFTTLLLARIILAASCSIVIVVSVTTAANTVTPEMRGRAIGVIFMGISSSLVFGVPLGRLVGQQFGWRMTFLLLALLSLISMAGIMKFLPKVPPQPTVPLKEQLATLKSKHILSIHFITFLELTGHFSIYTYLTPLLKQNMGLSTNMISIVLLIMGIAGIIGGGIGGWASDKFGGDRTIIVILGLLTISLFSLPYAAKSIVSILVVVILWGALTWAISPSVQDKLAKAAPDTAEIQIGLNNSFAQLGIALGSSLGGILINNFSVITNTWVSGIIVTLSLCSAIYSVQKKNKVVVTN